MNFITLISDWNSADYYIGAIKGRILNLAPQAVIIDVNHQVTNYNISQAAFVLKYSYKNFPKGSIHLIAVNSEAAKEKPIVAVKYDGHYFIGADNGMFHLFMEGPYESVIEISSKESHGSFPELEIFTNAAAKLANGEAIDKLGTKRDKLFKRLPVLAAIEESVIIGQIIYIDSYQNVITNVTKELFDQVGKNRPFQIYVQSKSNKITSINKSYNETSEGELLALFNSVGHLEIAIRNGKVAELLNLTTSSSIRIVFEEGNETEPKEQGTLF
jgi:S-adenosylmethionine hydrolase